MAVRHSLGSRQGPSGCDSGTSVAIGRCDAHSDTPMTCINKVLPSARCSDPAIAMAYHPTLLPRRLRFPRGPNHKSQIDDRITAFVWGLSRFGTLLWVDLSWTLRAPPPAHVCILGGKKTHVGHLENNRTPMRLSQIMSF